ncbi:MAG: hypothetical protein ACYTF6_03320 [Planctomycetota bacterium]
MTKSIVVGIVLLLGLAETGCILPCSLPSDYGELSFSPDGEKIAYVRVHGLYFINLFPKRASMGEAYIPLTQEVQVRFCSANSPLWQTTVPVCKVGPPSWQSHVDFLSRGSIRFSPDSKHLAAVSPGGIFIVELASGRRWRVTGEGELPGGMTWLSAEEIAYTVQALAETSDGRRYERAWHRQKIHAPTETRACVYRDRGPVVRDVYTGIEVPPRVYWSPTGRYGIFAASSGERPLTLLDIESGKVLHYGDSWTAECKVVWREDSSAAFCVAPDADRYKAVLIETGAKRTADLSAAFSNAFPHQKVTVDDLWTCDGRCFIVNAFDRGDCLVWPEPWRVVPLGQRAAASFGWPADWRVWVDRLPVPGWVLLWGPEYKPYAADYSGERLVPLKKIPAARSFPDFFSPWLISPGARRVARLYWWPGLLESGLDVRRIDLSLPPVEGAETAAQ